MRLSASTSLSRMQLLLLPHFVAHRISNPRAFRQRQPSFSRFSRVKQLSSAAALYRNAHAPARTDQVCIPRIGKVGCIRSESWREIKLQFQQHIIAYASRRVYISFSWNKLSSCPSITACVYYTAHHRSLQAIQSAAGFPPSIRIA